MTTPSASPRPRTTPFAPIGELVKASPAPVAPRSTEVEIVVSTNTQVAFEEPDKPHSWLDAALAARARRGPEAMYLSPGMVIPGTRYRLVRWLGDGGMGVVYEAEHMDIERRVAVKILRPEVCDHPRAVQLFRDEARAAARIGSAHIIEVVDFAELQDGRLLYAMELLHGRPLSRELGGRALPPSRVIAILRQLCKGLASAHAAHIVHRDIKPDNIFLLQRDSRPDGVKILDFGIATFMVEATSTDSSVVGTPHYLAPEIIAGLPFDARVDMYAVGCTGYEMLTGRPPFEGSMQELLHAHLHSAPPAMATIRGDGEVPASLEAVIMRCLAKRPKDRYADMEDLEAALCEAQIEAKLETAWDDLSLPNVEAERRDGLLRGMPDPVAASLVLPRPRRRSYVALALVGVLALAGAVYVGARLAASGDVTDPEVARLESEARAAAARVAFVYPIADAPAMRTAYQVVLDLEDGSESRPRDARERARTLRREFAGTLGAFGDRLWAREGGLEFAVDAYAQALLFDPDLEPAASRANLTPGQLARLGAKAATGSFSETELIAAEPLVVLAESEKIEASPALRSVRERIARRTRERDSSLTQLADASVRPGVEPVAVPVVASEAASEPAPSVAPSVAPVEAVEPVSEAAETGEVASEAKRVEVRRDPGAAAKLVEQAHAAARSGRSAEAERLFERALAHDNRNPEALAGLAELHFNRGAYSRALSFGTRAAKLAPNDASLQILIGDAAFKGFHYDDARVAYERAKQLGSPEAAGRLAKLAAKLGD